MSRFELFYGKDSPFSQHHRCKFRVGDMRFFCAEQYMMYRKAEVFNDDEIKARVLYSTNPGEIKRYGREVKDFDIFVWMKEAINVVKTANHAKFSQDDRLKAALFKTYPKELVEASPSDSRWGIGLGVYDPRAHDQQKWRGRNLLGQVLTNVRDDLMIKEKVISDRTIPVLPLDQSEGEKDRIEYSQYEKTPRKKDVGVKFSFFWGQLSPFSDDHVCEFRIDDITFHFLNQYMFYCKAKCCNDFQSKKRALSIRTPEELYDNGKVSNYDHHKWYDESYDVYNIGLEAKFSQNEHLKKELLKTHPLYLLCVKDRERQSIVKAGHHIIKSNQFKERHWKAILLNELRERLVDQQLENPSHHTSPDANYTRTDEPTTSHQKHVTNTQQPIDKLPHVNFSDILFYKNDHVFSDLFMCDFEVDGVCFRSIFQYISYVKADLFKDNENKTIVMGIKPPHIVERFYVKNFDNNTWEKMRDKLCRKGLLAKFNQNPILMKILLESHPKAILQDGDRKINQINIKDPYYQRSHWKDFLLMEARDELMTTVAMDPPLPEPSTSGSPSDMAMAWQEEEETPVLSKPFADARVDDAGSSADYVETPSEGRGAGRIEYPGDSTEQYGPALPDSEDKMGHSEQPYYTNRFEIPQTTSTHRHHQGFEDNSDQSYDHLSRSLNTLDFSTEDVPRDDVSMKRKGRDDKGSTGHRQNKSSKASGNDRRDRKETNQDIDRKRKTEVEAEKQGRQKKANLNISGEKRSDKASKGEQKIRKSEETHGRTSKVQQPVVNKEEEEEEYKKDYRSMSLDDFENEKKSIVVNASSELCASYNKDCSFTLDAVEFCSVAQFVEYTKADTFGDDICKSKILRFTDAMDVRVAGNEVRNFISGKWFGDKANEVTKTGHIAKFEQNPKLRKMLFDTYPRELHGPPSHIATTRSKKDQKKDPKKDQKIKLGQRLELTDIRDEMMRAKGLID